jgi:hypothetical protein
MLSIAVVVCLNGSLEEFTLQYLYEVTEAPRNEHDYTLLLEFKT